MSRERILVIFLWSAARRARFQGDVANSGDRPALKLLARTIRPERMRNRVGCPVTSRALQSNIATTGDSPAMKLLVQTIS
jgi:hypothetical protein